MLGWVGGEQRLPKDQRRIFYSTRFGRGLGPGGYCRLRQWRVYGERGLADTGVAVWLYSEHRTVAFADERLAQFHIRYAPDKKHLNKVTLAHLFETPHRSQQLPLWELSDGAWLKVIG